MIEQPKKKYEVIKQYLIDNIRRKDLKNGDQIMPELELMEKLNVSRHTIRKAIDELVVEGWLTKQQGRGTFVNDPEANMNIKGKLVGVVTTYLNDYIFPEIISGIESVLSKNNCSIVLGNTENSITKERQVLSSMLNNGLSGLIIEPTKSVFPAANKDLLAKFKDKGIPILYMHTEYNELPSSFVVEDEKKAGYLATKHLIELGHKRVAGIFKSDDRQGHGRYEGYLDALLEYEIEADQNIVTWFTTETKEELFEEANFKKLYKSLELATAIVCYNDQLALLVFNALKKMGSRVPEDYSIVSFDNAKLAQNGGINLTTVAHPKERLGEEAAFAIIELMHNKQSKIEITMKPELIVRESTKKLQK